jgi:transcriptional regulator
MPGTGARPGGAELLYSHWRRRRQIRAAPRSEPKMYVPQLFAETRVPVLHQAIEDIRFGTLVTLSGDGLEASHVPMLLDPEPGPYGTLSGHLARTNPQWRSLAAGAEALAIFLGPYAYVSPSWYPSKQEHGKVVPTWNYVAIHAAGPVTFHDDASHTLAHVTRLTAAMESGRAQPWAVSDAPADFIRGMVKGIIGFELPITRLEGKWKMSQNRPGEDRAGVVEGLRREGGVVGEAVAGMVVGKDGG